LKEFSYKRKKVKNLFESVSFKPFGLRLWREMKNPNPVSLSMKWREGVKGEG